tara:strand:+ start:535 stop:897 length:363 start_codon:yes stop_codon:yes gene_type:complete
MLSLCAFSFNASADCSIEKRPIQELLYEEKQDLITSYCRNHATYLNQYGYAMSLLELGVMNADYYSAERKMKQCSTLSGGENNLIAKVLKKDHGHEIDLEKDCTAYLNLYKSAEETWGIN